MHYAEDMCLFIFNLLKLFDFTVFRYKEHMGSGGTIKRMHIVFSGRVQGVGFRYTVRQVSDPFEVTGFVRNLPDGNVEVITEGVEQELSDFLDDIRSSSVGRYIARERIQWLSATGEFDSFRISH